MVMAVNQGVRNPVNYGEDEIRNVVRIFKALADPTRLRVVSALIKSKSVCVSDIAELLGMSISRVSHHLSILDKLGFTRHKQNGKQVFYTISDDCITDILARAHEHVRGK
jgi:DNA-binding transcriptional ArsR family regulator